MIVEKGRLLYFNDFFFQIYDKIALMDHLNQSRSAMK